MKTTFGCALVVIVAFMATTRISAQEWTAAQKEVWKVVEDGWTKWKAGDIDGMAATLHEKYQGWSDRDPLPVNKAQVIQWYQDMKTKMKVEYYFLNPARILVMENAAVVDYFYEAAAIYTLGEKKEMKEMNGKSAEFYIKEGGKWLLLGDMTTHDSKGEKEED